MDRRSELQRCAMGVERLVEQWESVVQSSTQAFGALCNVAARRVAARETAAAAGAKGGSGPGTAEAAKLEHYMAALVRALELLRDTADKLARSAGAAAEAYAKPGGHEPTDAPTARTATDASALDILEAV
jgi:hypothetical protein